MSAYDETRDGEQFDTVAVENRYVRGEYRPASIEQGRFLRNSELFYVSQSIGVRCGMTQGGVSKLQLTNHRDSDMPDSGTDTQTRG